MRQSKGMFHWRADTGHLSLDGSPVANSKGREFLPLADLLGLGNPCNGDWYHEGRDYWHVNPLDPPCLVKPRNVELCGFADVLIGTMFADNSLHMWLFNDLLDWMAGQYIGLILYAADEDTDIIFFTGDRGSCQSPICGCIVYNANQGSGKYPFSTHT